MVLQRLSQGISSRIDPGFTSGETEIDLEGLLEAPTGRRVELDQVSFLVAETITRFNDDRAASDAWLGPRLHAALRLSRRQAADRGVWRFMGVAAHPEYVRWRWTTVAKGTQKSPAMDRFVGPDYKQALARLWWMAELFRNGNDYAPAATALGNQDITNTLLRMDVAHHRPTALAVVRALVAGGKGDAAGVGREAVALSRAANSAATTLSLDLMAPVAPPDETARATWAGEAFQAGDFLDDLPAGPEDGFVEETTLVELTNLMSELLKEAPIRGRASSPADPPETESDTPA